VGTDIVHQHPTASGAAIGEASLRDFRIFASSVSKLGDGGVVINHRQRGDYAGGLFEGASSVARNLGHSRSRISPRPILT
jgi:hypothetical protein